MVGGLLLERLRADPAVREIHLVGRRAPAGIEGDARVRCHETDFARLTDAPPWATADCGYCCLGTTLRAAGSQEAFRAVDHAAVLAFARALRRGGTPEFRVVSSVGADSAARSFYLRVKGETERDLAALGFPRLLIFQPGLLRGPRTKFRRGEHLFLAVAPIWELFLQGRHRRYRTTRAADLAAAMHCADATQRVQVMQNDAIARAPAQPAR
jgi:uncharacterized protein YbjT (DUF2867 family)